MIHLNFGWPYSKVNYEFWISISKMMCYKWCWGSRFIIHLCLFMNFCIRKVIYVVQINFPDSKIYKWHISYKFACIKFCDLTYGYEYLKKKSFKSLKKHLMWIMHIWFDLVHGWCPQYSFNEAQVGGEWAHYELCIRFDITEYFWIWLFKTFFQILKSLFSNMFIFCFFGFFKMFIYLFWNWFFRMRFFFNSIKKIHFQNKKSISKWETILEFQKNNWVQV